MNIEKIEENTTREGTKKLWIAHNDIPGNEDKEKFVLLKTPKNQHLILSDGEDSGMGVKKEIRIQFDEETYLILNEKGITLAGKTITIEGSEKVVINKSELTP